jgi:ABC-type Na+ efflux pump permease subunit
MIAILKKELRDHLRDRGAVTMVLVFVMMVPFLLGGLFTVIAGREDLAGTKAELAQLTNAEGRTGGVEEALRGADVLIGVSGGRPSNSSLPSLVLADIIRLRTC